MKAKTNIKAGEPVYMSSDENIRAAQLLFIDGLERLIDWLKKYKEETTNETADEFNRKLKELNDTSTP